MTFSEETMRMADQILESADLSGDFIEHHGVKGQKHGVRRYQNEDGSLTALGRQHYGIFERMRNHFSPASKGYRAAQKQKNIDEKIKYQQKVNELKRLKSESKEEEYRVKQMKREDIDERKTRKFDQKMREKELESKERQFKLQQKTMRDIQKQKDKAQAEREQAAREYQTQQEIAKGKTLLGRLQKGAKMLAAISGMTGSGKKIAEALGIDTSKLFTERAEKNGDESASEKPKNEKIKSEKTNTEKPKTDMPKPDIPHPANRTERPESTKDEYTNEKGQKLLPVPKESKQSRKEKRKQHEAELRDEIEKSVKREKDYQKHTQEAYEWEGIYDTAVKDKNKQHDSISTKGSELGGNFSESDTKRILKVKERTQAQAAIDELDAYDAMMSSTLSKQNTQSVTKKAKVVAADIFAKIKGEPKPSDLETAEKIRNELARKEQRKRLQATVDSVSDDEYESVKSMVRERMENRDKQRQAIDEERVKRSEKKVNEREKQKAEAQERLRQQRKWMAEQEKKEQAKENEREKIQEAKETASEIKEAFAKRARLAPGPQTELAKAVSSTSVTKLAQILSSPIDERPKQLKVLNSEAMMERLLNPEPTYLESLRNYIKYADVDEEDDMEDAGEIEDAE